MVVLFNRRCFNWVRGAIRLTPSSPISSHASVVSPCVEPLELLHAL